MISSIQLLDYHFNNEKNYPIVIFHTPEVDKATRDSVKRVTPSTIYFEEITFDFPVSLQSPKDRKREIDGSTCVPFGFDLSRPHPWPLNYLHMNRFFSYKMYLHPRLQQFEYYMRIDTDLYFSEKFPIDPFEELVQKGATFAYTTERSTTEPAGCVVGLKGIFFCSFRLRFVIVSSWI